ncbi:hypothetical protein ACW7N6_38295 [Streptomyces sp. UC1A3]
MLRKLWRRLNSPKCDRCGKSTERPWLYQVPHSWWRCEPCEREVTDILFGAARDGRLAEQHLRYTRPPHSGT